MKSASLSILRELISLTKEEAVKIESMLDMECHSLFKNFNGELAISVWNGGKKGALKLKARLEAKSSFKLARDSVSQTGPEPTKPVVRRNRRFNSSLRKASVRKAKKRLNLASVNSTPVTVLPHHSQVNLSKMACSNAALERPMVLPFAPQHAILTG